MNRFPHLPPLPLLLYSYLASEILAPFFASFLILNSVFFLVKQDGAHQFEKRAAHVFQRRHREVAFGPVNHRIGNQAARDLQGPLWLCIR